MAETHNVLAQEASSAATPPLTVCVETIATARAKDAPPDSALGDNVVDRPLLDVPRTELDHDQGIVIEPTETVVCGKSALGIVHAQACSDAPHAGVQTTLTLADDGAATDAPTATTTGGSTAATALLLPELLADILVYMPVASGSLCAAARTNRLWYTAVTRHMNAIYLSLLSTARINPGDDTVYHPSLVDPTLRRIATPTTFYHICVTRGFIARILAHDPIPTRSLGRLFRAFHYFHAWRPDETKVRALFTAVAVQRQPLPAAIHAAVAGTVTHALLLDAFVLASTRACHMGVVWAAMERLVERDARAALDYLAALVGAGARGTPPTAARVPPLVLEAWRDRERGMLRSDVDADAHVRLVRGQQVEVEKVPELTPLAWLALVQAQLADVDRRVLLNVNAWSVRWIAVVQQVQADRAWPKQPGKAPVAGVQVVPPAATQRWMQTSLLSPACIDCGIVRLLAALDPARLRSWEAILHQILACTNRWLGIVGAVSRIIDSVREHVVATKALPAAMTPAAGATGAIDPAAPAPHGADLTATLLSVVLVDALVTV
ncbi:hypothetical protein AMAG_15253 [Allomyces macrogynus ATCC 38327]|uniref:F-box domain-containing protein n=1 Tax=Allomyces macrogynus (strain ATCC 38327) TaxID=578462 RepID=A0A0L0T8F6_ALLM3|nr:hypothetical protein AMAG_15253 [Allomyces macrogynus ATCC 38327]|eukprot:KNE70995.1 hypothetical protein AMAG_15253 [Allomyces macrogynus ATCC 38327]